MENKSIKDFEDYLISPDGRVFSLKRQIYLKPSIDRGGYYLVGLYKSGKCYRKLLARLIAQTFILNPENKPEINHIDGDKTNNDISNLEWATPSENIQHAFDIGLKKPSGIPVNVYNYKTGKFLSTQPSQSAAARMYGVFQQNISSILVGKIKQTGGLIFTKS